MPSLIEDRFPLGEHVDPAGFEQAGGKIARFTAEPHGFRFGHSAEVRALVGEPGSIELVSPLFRTIDKIEAQHVCPSRVPHQKAVAIVGGIAHEPHVFKVLPRLKSSRRAAASRRPCPRDAGPDWSSHNQHAATTSPRQIVALKNLRSERRVMQKLYPDSYSYSNSACSTTSSSSPSTLPLLPSPPILDSSHSWSFDTPLPAIEPRATFFLMADPQSPPDWKALAARDDFKELVRLKARFLIPASVFFIAYYFALPVLVGWFPEVMKRKVIGSLNWAYLFALSQFFVAWALAFLYVRVAAKWDRQAAAVIEHQKR